MSLTITCTGVCQDHRAWMPAHNQSRYALGQKRCTKCGVFMDWEGLYCPCCGFKLRTNRRGSKRQVVSAILQ